MNNLTRKLINQSKRYISTINVNNITETIFTRNDYPSNKCKEVLKDKNIGVLGYGPQGRGQSLNLRDNGFNVNVGVRKGSSYDKALSDGWIPGESLFEIEESVEKSNIVQYLLSDAGQISQWDKIKPLLNSDKTLYFSHGFGIVYKDKTNIIPPEDMDVVLVAPKGAGLTVRDKFKEGKGINASYAIHQDYSGNAEETTQALAFSIGCGYLFKTTFENEVYSDLLGERCVLMGLIQGAFLAQYNVLRKRGHSPSEAYNETVEEALESLYPLVFNNGMDWMFKNCSTTAQRGAIDWSKTFEKVLEPVIDDCYLQVMNGQEADRVISCNSDPNYRDNLEEELDDISRQELWITAKEMRKFRVNPNPLSLKDNSGKSIYEYMAYH
jgi:ketol-acid reductoisomerase